MVLVPRPWTTLRALTAVPYSLLYAKRVVRHQFVGYFKLLLHLVDKSYSRAAAIGDAVAYGHVGLSRLEIGSSKPAVSSNVTNNAIVSSVTFPK